ncbi:MAG: hypothetical protein MI861_27565 [Pirellulales bacterium]|nr:hypothetical protein [Pirellulales bacterium]
MCADCHSTNLQRNFDARTNRYRTTFSEIDVSCEACHGPGSLHIELAKSKSLFWDRNHRYGLAQLKGDDAQPQLQTCAPCHSRRGLLAGGFKAGDLYTDHYSLELLHDNTYHADGQIKDEVYVYGSFVQSKMHHKGIRCTDCHDPHSLKLKATGNQTCTSCHQHAAGKYDVPSHHHHQPGTPGAACVNCHMPHTTYMDVDPRRDHSLRIPRPDLSVKLHTPNACSGCHVADRLEKIPAPTRQTLREYADWLRTAEEGNEVVAQVIAETDKWCDQACEKWYGEKRIKSEHFAEALVAFRSGEEGSVDRMLKLATKTDDLAPPIARATALGELARAGVLEAYPAAREILDDPRQHPIVRAAAAQVFTSIPGRHPQQERAVEIMERALVPHLDDPSRLVRSEAARVLVASGIYPLLDVKEQVRIDRVLEEVHDALAITADRSGAHMSWAMLCESRGRIPEAIEAYRTAIRVEPTVVGPRTNLALLLERLAANRDQAPERAQQFLAQAQNLRAEELPLLARDAALLPDNPELQYRYGLLLYLNGHLPEALQQLERAVQLAPEVEQFRSARDQLKEKMSQ